MKPLTKLPFGLGLYNRETVWYMEHTLRRDIHHKDELIRELKIELANSHKRWSRLARVEFEIKRYLSHEPSRQVSKLEIKKILRGNYHGRYKPTNTTYIR